ncbi:MAG TPA: hypothetical protein VMW17_08175 [Candidatus Binatia bacterium]|nr:hypothetical protein [Candidatus Binatia bacterium]
MSLADDTLSEENRTHLQEFARRMRPHVQELVAEWAEAWLRASPASGVHVSEQLRHVGQTIVQSLEIEPVLDVTLQTAVQLLDSDSGLTLANREGTEIQLCRLLGSDQSYVGQWAPIDGNLNGWVYRHNQPVRSDRPLPEIGERSRSSMSCGRRDACWSASGRSASMRVWPPGFVPSPPIPIGCAGF